MEPVLLALQEGARLWRLYSPDRYGTGPLSFRTHGPHARFDHHRASDGSGTDAERGILYAGEDLVCCLGELFADAHAIETAGVRAAHLAVLGEIVLLDLRGTAALGVSTTQAIAGISQRKITQAWGRYLYEHPALAAAQGLLYTASNTGRDAFAFFERADGGLGLANDLALAEVSPDLELAAHELRLPLG